MLIWLLLFSLHPAWAGLPECEVALAQSSSEMHLSATEVTEIQQKYSQQQGLPDFTASGGLLKWANIDPAKHTQIVLFSLNNFFGDNLIFHFSMLDYFRRKFPGLPIKVISPKAGVLSPVEDQTLERVTFPVRFTDFAKREDRDRQINILREKLPGFMKEHIKPGAFVLFDLTTLDKSGLEIDPQNDDRAKRPATEFYRVIHDLGATAVGVSNFSNREIVLGMSAVEFISSAPRIRSELWAAPHSIRLRTRSGAIAGVGLRRPVTFGAKNIYESWLQNLALLFGPDFYLKWDSQYFVQLTEDKKMISDLHRQNGLDSKKPYVLLNLNTFGRNKVRELTPVYASTLISICKHLILNYPNLNILAMMPETQFGPETQEDVLDFYQQNRTRMALISSSARELHPALVAGAKLVVSYDSGLAHLSSFLPPQRVLTVSLAAGMSDIWRRPGQPFVQLQSNEDPRELGAQITLWLDENLNK